MPVTNSPPSTAEPTADAIASPGLRIRNLRLRLKLSQKAFAAHMAVRQSTLSQIENGHYAPSYSSLARLAEQIPIDCNWLIRGVGTPFGEGTTGEVLAKAKPAFAIRAITTKALAGYSSDHRSETWLAAQPSYTIPGFDRPGDFRVFQSLGESMEPTIFDQDFLICERIAASADSFIGQVVLCVTATELLVKRLVNYTHTLSTLTLGSDNPRFKAVELGPDVVLELWHVTGRLTRNLSPGLAKQDFRIRQLEGAVAELREKVELLRSRN